MLLRTNQSTSGKKGPDLLFHNIIVQEITKILVEFSSERVDKELQSTKARPQEIFEKTETPRVFVGFVHNLLALMLT